MEQPRPTNRRQKQLPLVSPLQNRTKTLNSLKALSFALALLFSGQAQAAVPCTDLIPQEQRNTSFAVNEAYSPYSWQDAGKPGGIDIDIARLNFVAAGENLNVDLRFKTSRGALIGERTGHVTMRVPYDSSFKCEVEQFVFTGQLARKIQRFPEIIQVMDALNTGKTLAAMVPLGQLEHGLSATTDVHLLLVAGTAVGTWNLGYADIYQQYGLGFELPER